MSARLSAMPQASAIARGVARGRPCKAHVRSRSQSAAECARSRAPSSPVCRKDLHPLNRTGPIVMSITGISPQGFQRVNTLLGEVGRAIDPKSHAKTTVSDVEAKRIVQAFEKLEPKEKAEVAKALQALMQQDVFTVSDKARTSFAAA